MKASDLFVRALENEGVKYIFGIPGEENLDLLESLRKSTIRLIVTRHEGGAAFMAATVGRLTGHAGVALSTLGPGATNLVTGVAYAQLGGMPLVVVTGQKPIKKSKQGRFQIVDVVELMRPITKSTTQIQSGEKIPALVREAFRKAEDERPGATHLELPEDIAREETTATPIPRHKIRRPVADRKSIDLAGDMLRAARHPLILVGAGANRKMIADALVEFLQKTGIPFVNTQMGKGIVPTVHDQYLGTAALSAGDYIHEAIEHADLIVNVGHDVIEKPPFFMHADRPKVIHVNFTSSEVDEVYFPQIEIVGDVATSLLSLANEVGHVASWDFAHFYRVQKLVREKIRAGGDNPSYPVWPQRLVADTREAMPDDGIVCLDNGMYKIWFARGYRAFAQNTILLDNALATMGAGLPSAIAAKLVHPEKKVLAVVGDGGLLMSLGEIETAVRLQLDLTILVVNDAGLGMIKWKQAGMHFPDFGLDLSNPDFVRLAESFGARGIRIGKTEELLPILRKCLEEGGVNLIEVPIDYSENIRVLTIELSTKKAIK